MKFKIGDRVRINCPHDPWGLHGVVTTVISRLYMKGGVMVHDLDLMHEGDPVDSEPRWLEPYYDGNERVSWSSCAWQPSKISA